MLVACRAHSTLCCPGKARGLADRSGYCSPGACSPVCARSAAGSCCCSRSGSAVSSDGCWLVKLQRGYGRNPTWMAAGWPAPTAGMVGLQPRGGCRMSDLVRFGPDLQQVQVHGQDRQAHRERTAREMPGTRRRAQASQSEVWRNDMVAYAVGRAAKVRTRHFKIAGGCMNWLTSRLAELSSFRALHESAQFIGEIPIRMVPLKYVEDALSGIGVQMDFGELPESLTSGFHLYTEDYAFAAPRPGMAPAAFFRMPIADPSFWFTTVLGDGQGTGVYLPDDDSDDQDAQFFIRDRRQRISRVHLTGELTSASARLTSVRQQEPGPGECADGYCTERVGTSCGSRCHCRELPDPATRVRGRLTRMLRFPNVPTQVSVVKCTRDN